MTESDVTAAGQAYAASAEFAPTADERVVRQAVIHYMNGLRAGSRAQAEQDAKSLEYEEALLTPMDNPCLWCPPMLNRLARSIRSSASQLGLNGSQFVEDTNGKV